MVTEGGAGVRVNFELVFTSRIIRCGSFVSPRTGEGNKFMAALVYHKAANLTLESLLPETPDEVGAVAAEGGLLEEARSELVVLHLMHVLLAEGPLPGEAVGGLFQLSVGGVSHAERGWEEEEEGGRCARCCRLCAALRSDRKSVV